MNVVYRNLLAVAVAGLLAGCAGIPAAVGTRVNGPPPAGTEREITGGACGFQLFLFIPINVNNRLERANQQLELAAGGDFITEVQIQERWIYAFVGTVYCTDLQAKAIRAKSS